MKLIKVLMLAVSLLIVTQAQAALITTQEAALDAIFSQSSFGNDIIDIRIGAATELVFPSLLDITTNAEIGQLFGLHVGSANVVNFYFVDTIDYCSSFNTLIVGCGEFPGNDFAVESIFAAGGFGGELLAHELGHNLGLGHLSGNFLMNSFLNGFTEITEVEVATIMSSSLVQTDGRSFWIDINPVLIVAEARIPEPSILILMFIATTLMGFSRNRKAA
ncbi:MAG: PEP-CTERM sorting domain-containing protein [Colwellia sp.]|nr:PEP-CTERM sorting domain-containing protein [Colwellia sp.]